MDRQFECVVTVQPPPKGNAKSDHNLVIRNIRVWDRTTQDRLKRFNENRRVIDLPRFKVELHLRMNLLNAIAAKLAPPTLSTSDGSVDGMASLLTETLLSNAVDRASPIRRQQVPRGWSVTEATKVELNARWLDGEYARKRVCSAPNDRGLREAFKAATKQLKRTRVETVWRFLKELR